MGDAGSAGAAARPSADQAVTRVGSSVADANPRFDRPSDHPWGGDAARLTTPDVAAQTMPGQPGKARDEEVA
jgi:hypothetical protein